MPTLLIVPLILLCTLIATIKAHAKPLLTKKSHELIKKTTKVAKAQIGKPYRYGGGHGDSGRYGFDCSGLASYIAKAAGYKGPVVTTYSAYAYSRPVRKSDRGKWIIRNWVQWGIRPGHMVVKVAGVIYEAAHSGVPIRRGVDRGYHWRVPYGIQPLILRKHIHVKKSKPHTIKKVVIKKPIVTTFIFIPKFKFGTSILIGK